MPFPIRVVGPRERADAEARRLPVIWTVSHARGDWQQQLSPFALGPVPLYTGGTAVCMENAWQFAKVYSEHVDDKGNPTERYWAWARDGWGKAAVRYPMGKGARPLYLLWGEERLDYVEARALVYWTLYRNAVRKTRGYAHLKSLHEKGALVLFDFDGYDHDALGMSLADVTQDTKRKMGHAFVLKAMLLYGEDVSVDDLWGALGQTPPAQTPSQGALF